MSTMITEECINCGACEPECPNTAIYEGGAAWENRGESHPAISQEITTSFPRSAPSASASSTWAMRRRVPADCCVPNPDDPETEEQLLAKARTIHPDQTFEGRPRLAISQK